MFQIVSEKLKNTLLRKQKMFILKTIAIFMRQIIISSPLQLSLLLVRESLLLTDF